MIDESRSISTDAPLSGSSVTAEAALSTAEPLPSIWRRNRRYVLMALIGGSFVGTPFLIFASMLFSMAVPLYFTLLFLAGGVLLIVGPAALTLFDAWHSRRKLADRNKQTS